MPSFNIHLAIAEKYLEKHNDVKNKEEFIKGIVIPDLSPNKRELHYTGIQDRSNVKEALKNKVVIEKYFKENKIETDFEKGICLHLLTDYLFFNKFFDKEYLEKVSFEQFCKDLYYSYDITNEYLENKYKIDYGEFKEEIEENIKTKNSKANYNKQVETNILPLDKLDKFIEETSNININKYKNI